jgi:hypothetical protein
LFITDALDRFRFTAIARADERQRQSLERRLLLTAMAKQLMAPPTNQWQLNDSIVVGR